MSVNLSIPTLGDKFQDYRQDIPGDSFNWGPAIIATDIKALTIHHSVTPQTAKVDGNWKAECDRIANLHLAKGWGGVGYRFIICSDGTVAYVGDLGRGGSGVKDHNHETFSACLIGDFTKELPTDAQIRSAHLLAKFMVELPQYPNLRGWDKVIGHKDWSSAATACPGTIWKGPSDSIYERIKNNLPYTPVVAPEPPPAVPEPEIPPTPTPPPVAPEIDYKALYLNANNTITKAKEILFGRGFFWVKLRRLKELLA